MLQNVDFEYLSFLFAEAVGFVNGFFDGAVSDLFEIMRAHDLTFAKKSDNEDCED